MKKLDTVQNQALRIASGAFRTSPIASINAETNTTPLIHRRNIQILNYFGKLLTTPDHINSYRGTSSVCPGSVGHTALQLLADYQLTSDQLAAETHPKYQRSTISKAVQSHLQCQWTSDPHPYLFRTIKPRLETWSTSFNTSRQIERVTTRVRLGHTNLTHIYLILRSDPPYCNSCHTLSTLLHILNDCSIYTPQRLKIYGKSPYDVYGSLRDDNNSLKLFVVFLKESKLFSRI